MMKLRDLQVVILLAGFLLSNLASTVRVERDNGQFSPDPSVNGTQPRNGTQPGGEQPPYDGGHPPNNGPPPNQQPGGNPFDNGQSGGMITSRNELLHLRKECTKMMKLAISERPVQLVKGCTFVDNFSIKNLSAIDAMMWLLKGQGDARSIGMLLDEKAGLSEDGLKTLLFNMTYLPEMKTMDKTVLSTFSAIGAEYYKRKSNTMTLKEAKMFGTAFMLLVPEHQFASLSDDLFSYILEIFSNQTANYMALQQQESSGQINGGEEGDVDYTGSLVMMASKDKERLFSLSRAAFRRYKGFDTLSVDKLDKLLYLLPLAPPQECKKLPNKWVRDNFDVLAMTPMVCIKDVIDNDLNNPLMDIWTNAGICGKYIAEKALTGSDALPFSTVDDMKSFFTLFECVPESFIMAALQKGNCSLAAQLLETRRPEPAKYLMKNCIQLPANISALTCSEIQAQFGPVIADMPMSFYSGIPESVLCENSCVDFFKGVQNLPPKMKRILTKKCFSSANKVLDSAAVDELGSMVTDLPPKKFREISPADLARNIASIKQEMKKMSPKRRRNKHAVLKEMGEKMIKSGQISSIMDSKEIMEEVSLNELKSSITNMDTVLNKDNLALTESQTKWVMRKLKQGKPASNYSVEEIRGRKSLVKGFLRSDIKEMAQSQQNSENSQSIEFAKALCEQEDFPLAPLQAINRNLIVGGLTARNASMPFTSLTDIDVTGLACQCLMHFNGSELSAMSPEVCSSVCTKIGSCERFQCMPPNHRREVQHACMSCMNFGSIALTEADMDLIGPSLLSQFPVKEIKARVTGAVLALKLTDIKGMCLNKALRTAISEILVSHFGSSGAAIEEVTLTMLGSAIMLFPVETQKQMDKTVILALAKDIMASLYPSDESEIKLKKCCKQWMTAEDLAHLQQLQRNMQMTIKDAVIYKMQNARKKRETVKWTCDNVQLIGEAFTTVSDAEISDMEAAEFTNCLLDIGQLTTWSDAQKTVLLAKAVSSLGSNVCSMTGDQLIQLGVISQAMSATDLACLPMSDTDLVSSLGALPGWSSISLATLANEYLDANNITNLTSIEISDVALLGEIICGFNTGNLATIPVLVAAGSGIQLGRLAGCSIPQYTALKNLVVDASAYGNVTAWSADTVTELNNILVGLSDQDVKGLSPNGIEGLTADVISQLPPNVLAAMTTEQFSSLTSAQISLVTDEQKASLSQAQQDHLVSLLGNAPTDDDNEGGGGDGGGGGGGGGGNNPSGAAGVFSTVFWMLSLAVTLFVLQP